MIGCDVVDVFRIEKILLKNKTRFLNKIFTKEELQYLNLKPESIAGYYAAKEAASKALGCGICDVCTFYDIIICKDSKNKPSIVFSNKVNNKFMIKKAHLSISHDAGVAMAVVFLEYFNE